MRILLALIAAGVCLAADVSVSTSQFDNARTGANTAETTLTQANVTGLVFRGAYTLDGKMYAQPLIDCGVNGPAPCVTVAVTMHDTIYAFDAKNPGGAPLWTASAGTPLAQADYPSIPDLYHDEVGCIATGVIDHATHVFYAVCVTKASGSAVWKVYSYNLADGTEFHAPVAISGTNNGLTFDPTIHMFRSALLLAGNNLVFLSTGYGDTPPYQGWGFNFHKTTLTNQGAVALTSTAGGEVGIWASGGGPVSDGTNVYFSTGNGTTAANNWGSSIITMSLPTLGVTDYGTPADFATLNSTDKDINSGGCVLIDNAYVICGGKDGRIFVMDKTAMGGLEGVGVGPHQLFAGQNGSIWGCKVYGNGVMYVAANGTTYKGFTWDTPSGTFNTTPVAISGGTYSSPGPGCAFSSNGATANTQIIWGVTPAAGAFSTLQIGTLRAWSQAWGELKTITMPYNYAKFAMPTVANGLVYVPTFSNVLAVYGLPLQPASSLRGTAVRGSTIR